MILRRRLVTLGPGGGARGQPAGHRLAPRRGAGCSGPSPPSPPRCACCAWSTTARHPLDPGL